MTLRSRRLLYLSFTLLFLLAAPPLLLYAQGYRYNWPKRRLERTAIISADSVPPGAAITLNGELRSERTPAQLKGLLPGSYGIRLELPGYQPWQRSLELQAGLASFTGPAPLLPVVLGPRWSEGQLAATPFVSLSPGGQALLRTASEASHGALFIWQDGPSAQPLTAALPSPDLNADAIAAAVWSPEENRLALPVANQWLLVKPAGAEVELLPLPLPANALGAAWQGQSAILAWSPNLLSELDLNRQRLRQLWAADPGHLLLAAQPGDEPLLLIGEKAGIKLATLSGDQLVQLSMLPGTDQASFLKSPEGWLAIADERNHYLYLFNRSASAEPALVISQFRAMVWYAPAKADPADVKLALVRDHELLLWQPGQSSPALLNRYAEAIDDLAWEQSGHYLYLRFGSRVEAIEAIANADRNTYPISDQALRLLPSNGQALLINRDGIVGLP